MEALIVILVTAFIMGLFMVFFSFIVESVVEYLFGIPADYIPWLTKNKGWMTPIVAIAIGIAGAFIFKLDIFYIYGLFVEGVALKIANVPIALNIPQTSFGIVLTGFFLARGSNFVHEAFKRWFKLDTALKEYEAFGEPMELKTGNDAEEATE